MEKKVKWWRGRRKEKGRVMKSLLKDNEGGWSRGGYSKEVKGTSPSHTRYLVITVTLLAVVGST